jgi:hypothetical protein
MDKLFLILIMIPIIGYTCYKIITYDWSNHNEDIKSMGDDIF